MILDSSIPKMRQLYKSEGFIISSHRLVTNQPTKVTTIYLQLITNFDINIIMRNTEFLHNDSINC